VPSDRKRLLVEEALPEKPFRRFTAHHEIPVGRERRKAVVALPYEGWAHKSVARYLEVDRSTVHRVLRRSI
jgi:transcriptional regulator of acetoin/glycerol metabolism